MAKKAKIFEDLPYRFYVKYAVAITLYISTIAMILVSTVFSTCNDLAILSQGIIIFLIETGLYIALIVLYSSTINLFRETDLDIINFVKENKCSDGPL